jgi:hypothetical protein
MLLKAASYIRGVDIPTERVLKSVSIQKTVGEKNRCK